MTGTKSLRLMLVLAVTSIAGIIGMLLFEGAGDVLCLVLAALPLAIGVMLMRKPAR